MTTTRLAGPTVIRAADLDASLLRAAGLELERVVMLEPTGDGLTLRKLTAAEKLAHTEATGEAAFLGSEKELQAYLDVIPAADDPAESPCRRHTRRTGASSGTCAG